MSYHGHICGCYYILPDAYYSIRRHYLPAVDVKVHSTILSTTSRTTLTQKFIVPSQSHGIRKLTYTFPLFDGVSVVGFTCRVADRIINGQVQEKEQAKKTFQEAVDRGETAGLLEQLPQASDVFTTTIGNVPPGAEVYVDITYLGELHHDAQVDGIRFTIPTTISPRYGNYPGTLATALGVTGGRFEVTVDTELENGFFIREMRSPSHPIAVSLGATSLAPDAEPSMNKASATLSLASAEMDKDFVIQIVSKEFGTPTAILETHPNIPGSRALMATLVPKFQLTQQRPEIVFVCDRSGSMGGGRIKALSNALQVFLKSLPVGVVFNICSFGSRHTFLWDKSMPYNQANMETAMAHVKSFDANYGGTEMLNPVRATMNRRFKDRNLEIFLVTDGEIWDQEVFFDHLNQRIQQKKEPVRLFTLGIGNGVSHALIQGAARAGNGFSQAVGENEKLDAKVVRMVKAALFPHITDYRLEIKYEKGDDGFEMVEKVADSLQAKLSIQGVPEKKKKSIISLFNKFSNPDDVIPPKSPVTPAVETPHLLQAPQEIPSLFPFNRTTVYIIMSPDCHQGMPKSVVLSGTCSDGPLELEIPIRILDTPGETIHQLAAKKAVLELEEGRGWLSVAKTKSGKLVKDEHPSSFDEMVRLETVRLGTTFQVGGKNCSFVAVEKKVPDRDGDESMTDKEEYEFLDDEKVTQNQNIASTSEEICLSITSSSPFGQTSRSGGTLFGKKSLQSARILPAAAPSGLFGAQVGSTSSLPSKVHQSPARKVRLCHGSAEGGAPGGGGSSGDMSSFQTRVRSAAAPMEKEKKVSATPFGSGSYASPFGSGSHAALTPQSTGFALSAPPPLMSMQSAPQKQAAYIPGAPSMGPPAPKAMDECFSYSSEMTDDCDEEEDEALSLDFDSCVATPPPAPIPAPMPAPKVAFGSAVSKPMTSAPPVRFGALSHHSHSAPAKPKSDDEILRDIISLQKFEGNWSWDAQLCALLGVSSADASGKDPVKSTPDVFATAMVVLFLETRLAKEKETWELMVEKARQWMEGTAGQTAMEKCLQVAATLV